MAFDALPTIAAGKGKSPRQVVFADVIVVGGGGAGLAAAIEAAAHKVSVILLEKADALGGTTGRAVGSISTNDTPHQRQAGIRDTARDHYEDMGLLAGERVGRDNLALRDLYTAEVSSTFQWLLNFGLEFYGPLPEHPHRYPRMHTVLPNAGAYIHQLRRAAVSRGVDIRTGARARQLSTRDGAVVGILADTAAGEVEFVARRAVILTTGDFSSGPELKSMFMSEDVATVPGVNPLSTGDGHKMALAVGAHILNGDLAFGPELRFSPPPGRLLNQLLPGWKVVGKLAKLGIRILPGALFRSIMMKFLTTNLSPSNKLFEAGAILVNRSGRRFSAETNGPAVSVAKQQDNAAYIVFDQQIAEKFMAWPYFVSTAPGFAYSYLDDYRRSRKDIFFRALDIAALARAIGVDENALRQSIESAGNNGPDKADGGSSARTGLGKAPFYALGPVHSVIAMTEGGLAVTPTMQVMDKNDQPIRGLFAAGSTGQGGVLLEGHGHHIGWAFVSGRVAGRNAALGPS